jgi:hypothetical protein
MEVSLYSQAIDHLQQHQMCEFLNFGTQIKNFELIIIAAKQSLSLTSGLSQQP